MTTLAICRELGAWAPAWDALVTRMPRPSPFLRSWWLEAVGEAGAEFVVVADGDVLVGGIPVTTDRRRVVRRCRLTGSGPLAPHNLDLVSLPGREAEIVEALHTFLDRSKTGITDLFGVAPDSVLAESAPPSTRVDRLGSAPWIAVPADFDTYLASRPRKLRQELRRVQRRLEDAGAEYIEVGPSETESAIVDFEALHRQRWGRDSLLLSSFSSFLAALRAGARRGEVFFHQVRADGRVVASLVSIDVAGVCTWYQTGRDTDRRWSNSGTYLKAKVVERSCKLGHSRIDMCIGDQQVKLAWSDGQQPVLRVRWARGPVSTVALGGIVAVGNVIDAARARRAAAAPGQ